MAIEAIYRRAREAPQQLAMLRHGVTWTYADFAQAIERARLRFAAQAWPPRGTVLLAVDDLALAWICGLALRSLGYTTVSVPVDKNLGALLLPDLCAVVCTTEESPSALLSFAAQRQWASCLADGLTLRTAAELPLPQWTQDHASAGHVLMTSGTTGSYKMVLRDARAEAITLARRAAISGIDANSVVFAGAFPMLTAGGYHWPLMTWGVGGMVIFHQQAHPHLALQGRKVTHCFATPSTLNHLLQAPPSALERSESMRLLVTGGALPRVLAEAARTRLTPAVFTVYASTEALTVAVSPYDFEEHTQWHRVHSSREVQVVDDTGQVLPAGETGLVRVRLLDGLQGYLHDAAATARFFRDGYFYPGDLGVLAADGRLALQGRVTEVVNALGSKIATAPVEQQLQDQLGVQAVCLFSVEQPEGEEIHLVVETAKALDEASFRQVLQPVLGKLFVRFHCHTHPQFPRNAMGKVQRLRLQHEILSRAAKPA